MTIHSTKETRQMNMTPDHKFTIGQKQFLSKTWPVRSKTFKNLPTVGSVFVVPISVLMGSGGENLKEAVAMAAELLFQKLSDPEVEQLLDLLLEEVFIKHDGGWVQVNADEHFEDIDELLQCLGEVLKQHYGKLVTGKGSRNLFGVLVPLTQMQM